MSWLTHRRCSHSLLPSPAVHCGSCQHSYGTPLIGQQIMSGSSPQERKAPKIKYTRSTDTQYELFAKLKIMSVIWIAKRKKAGRASHFLPEISVFDPVNVCLTHKEALITERNWSSNTRQHFFFFKEKLFGDGSQFFKTSYPWILCATPYFRGFTGHLRCLKVMRDCGVKILVMSQASFLHAGGFGFGDVLIVGLMFQLPTEVLDRFIQALLQGHLSTWDTKKLHNILPHYTWHLRDVRYGQ